MVMGEGIRDGMKEIEKKESCVLITISIESSNGTRMNHKHYLIKLMNERGCHLKLMGLSKYLTIQYFLLLLNKLVQISTKKNVE